MQHVTKRWRVPGIRIETGIFICNCIAGATDRNAFALGNRLRHSITLGNRLRHRVEWNTKMPVRAPCYTEEGMHARQHKRIEIMEWGGGEGGRGKEGGWRAA